MTHASIQSIHARYAREKALSSAGVDINLELQHYGRCCSYCSAGYALQTSHWNHSAQKNAKNHPVRKM